MNRISKPLLQLAEAVAAFMMAAMFATFILQVVIRYTARIVWIPDTFPWLEPSNFGWTLEFCLALWLWLVFWGNAFVVRDQDHVSFDILYFAVPDRVRRGFIIVTGLAIGIGLLLSIDPTWDRFKILRLKKTATLSDLFGDWIRMRDVYAIYILFLIAVPARYFWRVWQAFRSSMSEPQHTSEGRLDE
ncbi:TRAP transporter small permease [Roseibium suaedae]|uniref:TRAP transporter small permease protein n=1 Tax=Roseibium suaedae TaxID=735517 RepID=A0A1M7MVW4_9HYPH|nr:TRAP transporter small permease subunit [Roseibium suaedae]SHM95297.1 C4-dicarboxylate transporter, DctQ subunit [Roseibium suaedae]